MDGPEKRIGIIGPVDGIGYLEHDPVDFIGEHTLLGICDDAFNAQRPGESRITLLFS